MKMKIKAIGVKLTPEIRKRIEWICEKLEETANVPNPDTLQCDIEVTAVGRTPQENRFRAEIYFVSPGRSLRASAIAKSPMEALDMAHDEIERKFFEKQRGERDKQRISDFTASRTLKQKQVEEEKKAAYAKEPPRRDMQTRVDE